MSFMDGVGAHLPAADPAVGRLFVRAVGGDAAARSRLIDLAVWAPVASCALGVLVDLDVDAAKRTAAVPVLVTGVEERLVAAVREELGKQ